uniref:uncharacterized protein LOC100183481 isoform X11 n=1 Tax=Ciona intestinalis TaxID=7719 RepID=UPI000EF44CAE|nr:uncharacterized protein LOC100183481 isoform X11 [Ciona intestinalis]|eukprot:XP_026692165.1 uncharacterized protein LOC100183481 isoform X11 [Ciona intestinalis]
MGSLTCNEQCLRNLAHKTLEDLLKIKLNTSVARLQKFVNNLNSQKPHSECSLNFQKPFCEMKLSEVVVNNQNMDLHLHPPYILHQFCVYLHQYLDVEGLFRIPGSSKRINILKEKLECGFVLSDENPHDVANLFTLFLRQIPDQLIPKQFHSIILQVMHAMQDDNQIKAIQCLCLLLPRPNLETLLYVSHLFQYVAEHGNKNKMSIDCLATMLAPNIVQFEVNSRNIRNISTIQTQFARLLLLHSLQCVDLASSWMENICAESCRCVVVDCDNANLTISMSKADKRRRSFADRMLHSMCGKLLKSHGESTNTTQTSDTPSVKTHRKKRNADVDSPHVVHPMKRRSLQGSALNTPESLSYAKEMPRNIQNKPFHFADESGIPKINFTQDQSLPCSSMKSERHDSGSTTCFRIHKLKPRKKCERRSTRCQPDLIVSYPVRQGLEQEEKTGRRLASHKDQHSSAHLTVEKSKQSSLFGKLKSPFLSPGIRRRYKVARKRNHHASADTLDTNISDESFVPQGEPTYNSTENTRNEVSLFDLSINTLISMNKPSEYENTQASCSPSEDFNSSQQVDDIPNNIQQVDDVPNNIQQVDDVPNHIQQVDDVPNHIQQVDDVPNNIQQVDDVPNHIQKVDDVPNHIQQVDDVPNHIQKVDDVPNNIQQVEDVPNNIQQVNDVPNNIQQVEDVPNNIQQVNDVPNNIQQVNDVPNNIQQVEDVPNNIQQVNDIPNNIQQQVDDVPNNIQQVNDIPNNIQQQVDDVPNNIQQVNDVPNNIQQVEDVPNNIQQVNDVPNNIQQVNDVPNNIQQVEDVPNNIQQVDDVSNNIQQQVNDIPNNIQQDDENLDTSQHEDDVNIPLHVSTLGTSNVHKAAVNNNDLNTSDTDSSILKTLCANVSTSDVDSDLQQCQMLLNEIIDSVVVKNVKKVVKRPRTPLTRSKVISRRSGQVLLQRCSIPRNGNPNNPHRVKRLVSPAKPLTMLSNKTNPFKLSQAMSNRCLSVLPSKIPISHFRPKEYETPAFVKLRSSSRRIRTKDVRENLHKSVKNYENHQRNNRNSIRQLEESGHVNAAIQHFNQLSEYKQKLPPLPYKTNDEALKSQGNFPKPKLTEVKNIITKHKSKSLNSLISCSPECSNPLCGKPQDKTLNRHIKLDYLDFSPVRKATPQQPRSRQPIKPIHSLNFS